MNTEKFFAKGSASPSTLAYPHHRYYVTIGESEFWVQTFVQGDGEPTRLLLRSLCFEGLKTSSRGELWITKELGMQMYLSFRPDVED